MLSNQGDAFEHAGDIRLHHADQAGVAEVLPQRTTAGVAMTASPIQFGRKTAMFIAGVSGHESKG